jgi:hypothetical protein
MATETPPLIFSAAVWILSTDFLGWERSTNTDGDALMAHPKNGTLPNSALATQPNIRGIAVPAAGMSRATW